LAHTVLPDNFNHALLVPLLLALTGVLFLLFMLRNKKESDPMRTFTELFVLVALIPNLAHTDTEHFMWSWPLIAYSVLSLIQMDASRRWMPGTLLFLAFIPYCLNSPDIVGKSVRFLFDEGGMLGLANLVIIGVSIYLYRVSGRIATSGR